MFGLVWTCLTHFRRHIPETKRHNNFVGASKCHCRHLQTMFSCTSLRPVHSAYWKGTATEVMQQPWCCRLDGGCDLVSFAWGVDLFIWHRAHHPSPLPPCDGELHKNMPDKFIFNWHFIYNTRHIFITYPVLFPIILKLLGFFFSTVLWFAEQSRRSTCRIKHVSVGLIVSSNALFGSSVTLSISSAPWAKCFWVKQRHCSTCPSVMIICRTLSMHKLPVIPLIPVHTVVTSLAGGI